MLGFDAGPADFSFVIPDSASTRIDALLAKHGTGAKLLVVAPGSIWETKRWRIAGFAEVARHFVRQDFAVAPTGSQLERAVCEAVAAAAGGVPNLPRATNVRATGVPTASSTH